MNRDTTCYKCHKTFTTPRGRKAYSRKCRVTKRVSYEKLQTPSPTEPCRRTCGYCHKLCDSRNQLFKHLDVSEDARNAIMRPRPDVNIANHAATISTTETASVPAEAANNPKSGQYRDKPIIKEAPCHDAKPCSPATLTCE